MRTHNLPKYYGKEREKRIILLVTVAATALIFSSLVVNNDWLNNAYALSQSPLTNKELYDRSDLIVIGTITDTVVQKEKEQVWTDMKVDVEKYLKNPSNLTDSKIVAKSLGGTIGNYTHDAFEPVFTKGDRVLLFLNDANGSNSFNETIFRMGLYSRTIDKNDSTNNLLQFISLEPRITAVINVPRNNIAEVTLYAIPFFGYDSPTNITVSSVNHYSLQKISSTTQGNITIYQGSTIYRAHTIDHNVIRVNNETSNNDISKLEKRFGISISPPSTIIQQPNSNKNVGGIDLRNNTSFTTIKISISENTPVGLYAIELLATPSNYSLRTNMDAVVLAKESSFATIVLNVVDADEIEPDAYAKPLVIAKPEREQLTITNGSNANININLSYEYANNGEISAPEKVNVNMISNEGRIDLYEGKNSTHYNAIDIILKYKRGGLLSADESMKIHLLIMNISYSDTGPMELAAGKTQSVNMTISVPKYTTYPQELFNKMIIVNPNFTIEPLSIKSMIDNIKLTTAIKSAR